MRRRGVIRTAPTAEVLAIRRGRRMAGRDMPTPGAFVNLTLEDDAYTSVPCWTGGPTGWVHDTVAPAYDARYREVRPQMTSGGIARQTLLAIAGAMARHADTETGRDCRPAVETLAAATGFEPRTIQRARACLRLLGVATEVMRGRQRTYVERMASWRMGDQSRGWASVWVLHDSTVPEVIHSVSPHLERSQLSNQPSSFGNLVTTQAGAEGARHSGATRRPAPDEGGRRLAQRWRADPHAPPWARKFSAASWAGMLAAPAAAGWTPRDLTALVDDWLGTGHYIPDHPPRPIALLGAMLAWHTAHNTLTDRPAALDDARAAQERAAASARGRDAARERAESAAARAVGLAAATGPGRAAAFEALAAVKARRAGRS